MKFNEVIIIIVIIIIIIIRIISTMIIHEHHNHHDHDLRNDKGKGDSPYPGNFLNNLPVKMTMMPMMMIV